MNQPKNKMRILLEVNGVATPILFHSLDEKRQPIKVEDPQLSCHMNNIDDAIRTALYEADFEECYDFVRGNDYDGDEPEGER